MEIQKFQRKPFSVDGVCVTEKNIEEVAEWCLGKVEENEKSGDKYIRVDAHRPLTERQTMAFVGDWVLFHNRGFKVYTEAAFSRNFELVEAGTHSEHAEFEREDPNQMVLNIDLTGVAKEIDKLKSRVDEALSKVRVPDPTDHDA